jgi:hypothetical protein
MVSRGIARHSRGPHWSVGGNMGYIVEKNIRWEAVKKGARPLESRNVICNMKAS